MAEQAAAAGEIMLTVFLKHRQSMNLAEINQKLEETGFWRKFPPEDVEVVSWYVMMGIGQVVTLRWPAEQLRALNSRHSGRMTRFAVLASILLAPHGSGRGVDCYRGRRDNRLTAISSRAYLLGA